MSTFFVFTQFALASRLESFSCEHVWYIFCYLLKASLDLSNASKVCVEQTNTKTPKIVSFFSSHSFLG